MSYNVILLTDTPREDAWMRGYGAHQLANHIRANGYTCLVIDFSSALTLDVWRTICQIAVSSDTLAIGFSTTWWPFRVEGETFIELPVGSDVRKNHLRSGKLVGDFVNGNSDPWFQVARDINPKVKFVGGGPKVDFYRDVAFDHIVIGFGETQFLDLLRDRKRLWPVVINHDTSAMSPVWDFRQTRVQYNDIDQIQPNETLTLEITRGCRFKCAFCSYPLIGRKDFASAAKCEDVLYDELYENYTKWKTTRYFISDDTFNDTTAKLELLHRVVQRLPFKLELSAYTRIDVIATNPEQIQLLKEIGLATTFMGIESFHPTASRIVGKGMSSTRRKDALHLAKREWGDSVYVKAGYIVGLPGESTDHLREVVDWFSAPDSPVDGVHMNPLRILPPGKFPNVNRSELDREYEKYGYTFPDVSGAGFDEWVKNDGSDITSFSQARKIAGELTDILYERGKGIYLTEMQTSGHPDPRLYFENMVRMLLS